MRRFRLTARQRDGHDQRRRLRPVLQPKLGLQAGHAIIVRNLPGQPGLLTGRRPARVFAPGRGRRLIRDNGQRPACQAAAVSLDRQQAAARQVPLGLEAAVIQARERAARSFSDREGALPPPETLTVRCDPAGTETLPPSVFRKIGAMRV